MDVCVSVIDSSRTVGILSSPVIVGETIFIGSSDHNLYAIDAATGSQKWAYNNKGSWVIASPVVSDGTPNYAATYASDFYNETWS